MSSELVVAEEYLDKMAPAIETIRQMADETIPVVKFPNKEAYLEADRILAEANRTISEIERERMEFTKPLDVVKKKIMDAAKKRIAPLEDLKSRLRLAMGEYAMAERKHIDDERRRQIEADRKKKEDEQLRQAEEAQKRGLGEKTVDAILDKPIAVARPVVASVNDQASSTQQTVWDIEIVDAMAFVRAWTEGKAPTDSVLIDDALLKRIVRTNKGKIEWPGIRITERVQIGSGR